MTIALIWAMDRNRTIGKDNGLPWHLPGDLAFFKKMTLGKPVIMGRKTWNSLGRCLPGRPNLVVSRAPEPSSKGEHWFSTIEEAIDFAQNWNRDNQQSEVIIMGGASIYEATFALADRLYITHVDAEVDGDTRLPNFDMSEFAKVSSEQPDQGEKDQYRFEFAVYERQ